MQERVRREEWEILMVCLDRISCGREKSVTGSNLDKVVLSTVTGL